MARTAAPYLPMMDMFGMGPMGDPVSGKHGKSLSRQHMPSIIGRRMAGTSQITSGIPGNHSMGDYGKKGLPGLTATDREDF